MKKFLFSMICTLLPILASAQVQNEELTPYAVLEGNTLTFYYDDQKESQGGMDIGPFTSADERGWNEYCENIEQVVFVEAFAGCEAITSTRYWFQNFTNLTTIIGLGNLKTNNVTDMASMFDGCSSLTSLDLSGFNTSNVTYMSLMFGGCSSLEELKLSTFNTPNVQSMDGMFRGCSGLTSLDVSSFNTDNVTEMSEMFAGCSGLTSLDFGENFNTSNVTTMWAMFSGCSKLENLDLSNFNTANVENMSAIFSDCSSLKNLDISNFNTENVISMANMFDGCSNLESLQMDFNNFSTESVTNMGSMFGGCLKLKTLDLSGFKTSNVSDFSHMFASCSGLTSLDVTGFDTSNAENMTSMFSGCSGLTSLFFGENFNTSKVTTMSSMLEGCSKLESLNLSEFDTSNATDLSYMFMGCSSLTSLDLSGFNTDMVKDMDSMFNGCSSLTSLNLSSFNTSLVGSMGYMFSGCSSLTSLNLSSFETPEVEWMGWMFQGCSSLKTLDLSSFDTSKVIDMGLMFSHCSNLETIWVSDLWTDNNNNGDLMFELCEKLVGGQGTVYDADHINASYAHIDEGATNPGYLTDPSQPLPYAVLSENNTVLTFYYDNQKAAQGGMGLGPFTESTQRGWDGYAYNIQSIAFDESFANCTTITSTKYWFAGITNLTTLTGLDNLKTENVTDMSYMFSGCSSLTNLDLSSFTTSSVTDMQFMFSQCSGLETIYVGNGWSLESISSQQSGTDMFTGCTALIGGAGTTFDENHVDYTYARIDEGESNPGYLTGISFGDKVPGVLIVNNGSSYQSIDGSLTYFDAATGVAEQNVYKKVNGKSLGGTPNDVMVYGQKVYIVGSDENTIFVLDVRNFKELAKVSTTDLLGDADGSTPRRIAAYEDKVYFTTYGGYVAAIDTISYSLKAKYQVGSYPEGLALGASPSSSTQPAIYVANSDWGMGNGSISCIDLTSGSVTESKYDKVKNPQDIAAAGSTLYVLDYGHYNEDYTQQLDAGVYMVSGNSVTMIIPNATGMAATGQTIVTYNNPYGSSSINYSLYNIGNGSLNAFILSGDSNNPILDPSAIAIEPNTNNIYIASRIIDSDTGYPSYILPGFVNIYNSNGQFTNSFTTGVEPKAFAFLHGSAFGKEPYAILSENNTILTFYYDDQKAARNGMSVGPFTSTDSREWKDDVTTITYVEFDSSFADCTSITSTARWFDGCSNLTEISGISYLHTENVTSMRRMFKDCSSLTGIDLSHFNTENVTKMDYMFDGCSGLNKLDVSGFNTGNVTEMGSMFANCSSLKSLDVTGFNTESVTDISRMFYSCSGLTTLDLSNFNTANAKEDLSNLFRNCSSLMTIYVGSGWTTDNMTNGENMFLNCTNLEGGAGTKYDTNHTDHAYAHIDGGTSNPGYLTGPSQPRPYAVLSGNNTVLTFYYDDQKAARGGMDVGPFEQWGGQGTKSGWSDVNEQITTVVFNNSFANFTKLTSTAYWFYGCENLTTITGMSNLKTDNVTDINSMFGDCHSLKSIDFSSLNLSNVTNMHQVFEDCRALESIDFSGVNTENVTNMGDLFLNCKSLKTIDISSFNTKNVTKMTSMFYKCDVLTTIYVGEGWTTENVTESGEMFEKSPNLVGGRGTTYDENHIGIEYAHIDGGTSNPGYLTDINAASEETWAKLQSKIEYGTDVLSKAKEISSVDQALIEKLDEALQNANQMYKIHEASEDEVLHMIEVLNERINDVEEAMNQPASEETWEELKATIEYGTDVLAKAKEISTIDQWLIEELEMMLESGNEMYKIHEASEEEVLNMIDELNWRIKEVEEAMNQPASDEAWAELNKAVETGEKLQTEAKGVSTVEPWALEELENMTAKGSEMYKVHTAGEEEVRHMTEELNQIINEVEEMMRKQPQGEASFDGLTAYVSGNVTLDDAFKSVGGRSEAAKTIAAIVWNADGALTADMLSGIDNPNLLVYVTEASKAPSGVQNVIIDGVASEIVLTDATGNNNFYCPQSFTAKSISYSRDFSQTTEIDVCRGWETIALPFDVQSITHESHGTLVPFGGSDNGYPFWLRQLSTNGLARATKIEANRPYLICMPNNIIYPPEYNQNGTVTFSSSNVTVPVTSARSSTSAGVTLHATFQQVTKNSSVYALNVGETRGEYPEGSVFEQDYRDIRPFQAYTTHRASTRSFITLESLGGNDDATGIEELRIKNSEFGDAEGVWYSLDGRRLDAKPTKKGVYVKDGRKIVIK